MLISFDAVSYISVSSYEKSQSISNLY